MIDADSKLSIRRQCELLSVSRSGLYYEPVPTTIEELALMRRIDEMHLKWPFYGSRKVSQELRKDGMRINRKQVQRLMRLMGLESLAPKPNTSRPAPQHPVYPYLLRNLKISRVNQRCGRRTSRTSHLNEGSPIWWRSSTGIAAASCRGDCPTRSTAASASRRWTKR